MSLLQYIETRHLTRQEHAWARLAVAILRDYIESGCEPHMEDDWFCALCFLGNINPDDLQKKIDYIFGSEEDYE